MYLVGAGPVTRTVDPESLKIDPSGQMWWLHDRLVLMKSWQKFVRMQRRYMSGRNNRYTLPQEGINALLVSLAKQGKRVLRLKGG